MKITRLTTLVAALAAGTVMTACTTEGTPIPSVGTEKPDTISAATTNTPTTVLRPGAAIAIGEGAEKTICTMGWVLTDYTGEIGTTAAHCVSKDGDPVYIEDANGKFVLIGTAKLPEKGEGYSRMDTNVAFIALERGMLKEKNGIELLGSIHEKIPTNAMFAPTSMDLQKTFLEGYEEAGTPSEICWYWENTGTAGWTHCGTVKFIEGGKIGVTPIPDEPGKPPFYSPNVAGAPATATVPGTGKNGVHDTRYPLGTVTDMHDGTVLIDALVVQTSVTRTDGLKVRVYGN